MKYLLLVLITTTAFAQSKIEARVSFGNTNVFGEYQHLYSYESLSPLLGVSFSYKFTKKFNAGVFFQNEWHNRSVSSDKMHFDGPNESFDIKNWLSYTTIGARGQIFFGGSKFYAVTQIGYMINYKNTMDYNGLKELSKSDAQSVSGGLGIDFSRTWKVSPFVEIMPTGYFMKDQAMFGIQSRIGIRF